MEHGGAREGEEKLKDFSYSANPYRPPFVKRVLERAKIERYPYCNDRLENGIKNKLMVLGSTNTASPLIINNGLENFSRRNLTSSG